MTTSSLPARGPRPRIVRVLLVDDRPQVRQDLRQLLMLQEAVEVAGEAQDGEQALCLTAELDPDVVLMDLEMPGMNGHEATRRIKSSMPRVRVIILSVHAGPEERRLAQAAGADGFVVKGEDYEQLMNAIRGTGEPSNNQKHRKGKQA